MKMLVANRCKLLEFVDVAHVAMYVCELLDESPAMCVFRLVLLARVTRDASCALAKSPYSHDNPPPSLRYKGFECEKATIATDLYSLLPYP